MLGDGFEQAAILRTGPDGLTRIIVRNSWAARESILVEADAPESTVLQRWANFHKRVLGFSPRWAVRLLEATNGKGSVVVYSNFEDQRLAELEVALPDLSRELRKLRRRLFDLLPNSAISPRSLTIATAPAPPSSPASSLSSSDTITSEIQRSPMPSATASSTTLTAP